MADDFGHRGDAVLLHQPGDQARRAVHLWRRRQLLIGGDGRAIPVATHETPDQADADAVVVGVAGVIGARFGALGLVDGPVGQDDVVVADAGPLGLDQVAVGVAPLAVDVVVGDLAHGEGGRRVGVVDHHAGDAGGAVLVGRQGGMLGQAVHQIDHGRLGDAAAARVVLQQLGQAGVLAAQLRVLRRQVLHLRLQPGDLSPQRLHLGRQRGHLSGLGLQVGDLLFQLADAPQQALDLGVLIRCRFVDDGLHAGDQRLLVGRVGQPLVAGRAGGIGGIDLAAAHDRDGGQSQAVQQPGDGLRGGFHLHVTGRDGGEVARQTDRRAVGVDRLDVGLGDD